MLTGSRNDVASRLEVVEMAVWRQIVNLVVELQTVWKVDPALHGTLGDT